jgi:hypothetical protein
MTTPSSRNTPRGRALAIWRAARDRCGGDPAAFSLDPEWVVERVSAGLCEATGIPFDLSPAGGRRFARAFAPSIDRVDPSQPYTPENCRVVVLAYNVARGRWGDDAILMVAEGLAQTLRTQHASR